MSEFFMALIRSGRFLPLLGINESSANTKILMYNIWEVGNFFLSQIHFENGEKILNLLKIDKAKVG
jgi:hypothetical protein